MAKKQSEWMKADIKYTHKGKKYSYSIIHNCPEVFGMSFQCAFDNWIERTETFSQRDLCNYIRGKGFNAYTEKEYERYIKQLIK